MSEQNVSFDPVVVKGRPIPEQPSEEDAAVTAALLQAQKDVAAMPENTISEIFAKERASQLLGNEEKPLDMEKIESLLRWDGTFRGGLELERTLQLLGSSKTAADYMPPTGNKEIDDAAAQVQELLGIRPTAPTPSGGGVGEGAPTSPGGGGGESSGATPGTSGVATSGTGINTPGHLGPDAIRPGFGTAAGGGSSTTGGTNTGGTSPAGAAPAGTAPGGGGTAPSGTTFVPIQPDDSYTSWDKTDKNEDRSTTTYTDENGSKVTTTTTIHDDGSTTTTTTDDSGTTTTTTPATAPQDESSTPETLTTGEEGAGARTVEEAMTAQQVKGDSVVNPSGEDEAPETPTELPFQDGDVDPNPEASVFEITGIHRPVTAGPEFGEGGPETPEVPEGWTPEGIGPTAIGGTLFSNTRLDPASASAGEGEEAGDADVASPSAFDRVGAPADLADLTDGSTSDLFGGEDDLGRADLPPMASEDGDGLSYDG